MIENAKGELWESALRGDQNGYVPPGVKEWLPQERPVDYLDNGEQPHFVAASNQRALRVEATEDDEIQANARVQLDKIQRGLISEGQVGYLSAKEPYSNILFITDEKILLLVGKQDRSIVSEFEYDDIEAITTEMVIKADGLRYELDIDFTNERTLAYQYLHECTSLTVEGFQPVEDKLGIKVDLHQLKELSAESFEEYVAHVWQANGYSCKLTKGSGDSGIDIIAEKNRERVLIQAKKYTNNNVGIGTVQRSAGLLVDKQFTPSEVVIVTTAGYTKDAKDRAAQIDNLRLINGRELVKMIESL